jgi:hypothetical protein
LAVLAAAAHFDASRPDLKSADVLKNADARIGWGGKMNDAAREYYPPKGARIPKTIPDGQVLVHNHAKPAKTQGARGFRFWFQALDGPVRVVPCDCGWAPQLGEHHRPRTRVISHRDNPTGGPRPSQTWALIDPEAFEKMLKAGAIRRAEPQPPPAATAGDEPVSATEAPPAG